MKARCVGLGVVLGVLSDAATFGAVATPLCKSWERARPLGILDPKVLDEASGLVQSDANSFFHINDSGDGPYIYHTDGAAKLQRRLVVSDFRPVDAEELRLADCPSGKGRCLLFADIGDNLRRRRTVQVAVVPLPVDRTDVVAPERVINLRYADGIYDAEAFAVHPVTGDWYILTKSPVSLKGAGKARIYRLPQAVLAAPLPPLSAKAGTTAKHAPRINVTATFVGELDLPYLLGRYNPYGQIATSFDIAPDGKRFVVLTYGDAVEFAHDLVFGAPPPGNVLRSGVDYQMVGLVGLTQQEAIAYGDGGTTILYTSESRGTPESLMQTRCR